MKGLMKTSALKKDGIVLLLPIPHSKKVAFF